MNEKKDVFLDGRLCKVYKKIIFFFAVTKRMTKWEPSHVANCCQGPRDFTGLIASRLSGNMKASTSWNLLETSGPVQELFYLLLLLHFVKSGTEKQKDVNPILYCRKHIIFLTPKCDVLLYNYWSSCTGTVFGLTIHLRNKKLAILTNPTFYPKYYKTRLNRSAASQVQKYSHSRLRQC